MPILSNQRPSLAEQGRRIAMNVYGTMDPIPKKKPLIAPTTQPTTQPTTNQFQFNGRDPISMGEALMQAKAQTQPLYEQARTNAGVINQQQSNLLNQRLNARGMLGSGMERVGQVNLAGQLQQNLSNLDAQNNANNQQIAQQLREASMREQAEKFNQQLQSFNTNHSVQVDDRNFNYQTGRDKVVDKQFADKLNAEALERAMRQRESLANMWGVDPVTGKQTIQAKNMQMDNARQLASLDLQRQNMLDDSARGWAGLQWNQQEAGMKSAADVQKQIAAIRNNGVNYINSLSDKPTFDQLTKTKKISDGVGPKTKAVIISNYNKLIDEYLSDPDPYGSFQDEKAELYKIYKDKGYAGYLINALETSLSQYQAMGK